MPRSVSSMANPMTKLIATFMEDPKARQERFEKHTQRLAQGCKTYKRDLNLPPYRTDSWRPNQVKSVPGFRVSTGGKGSIQMANSLDAVIAFHENK